MNPFNQSDKVICIDDSIPDVKVYELYSKWIVKDQQYTVRSCTWNSITNSYRVLLNEVKNTPIYIEGIMANVEPGFDSKRFIKLKSSEDKTFFLERLGMEI